MPTDSGYSNQKKKGIAQFETVHNLGSESYGKVVAQKAVYLISDEHIVDSVEEIVINSKLEKFKITSEDSYASVGNVIRLKSAPLFNTEIEVINVIDKDTFEVLAISDHPIETSMMFDLLGWVTAKLSEDGAQSVTIDSAPTQFNLDGNPQTVEMDTTDATLNRALPNLNFIIKDGDQVPVTKVTGQPTQTVAMPVEIVSASGSEITINAGDISIQTSDMGANFDSMRIGDGSGNYIEVTSDKEARVTDAKVLSAVESLEDAVDLSNADLGDIKLATEATQTAVESLDGKDFATEVTLNAVKTAVESLEGKDFSTGAKQDGIISELQTLNTVDFATEAKQDGIISELQTIAGLDFSTETKQDGIISELQTLNTVDFATEATVNDIKTKLNSMAAGLVPQAFDHMTLSYVPLTTDISTVVYRVGGSGGTIVATITLGYDGDGNISTVARS